MTKSERAARLLRMARATAKEYRDLASELEQAARVLDSAGDLHSAYPTVTISRFGEAIQSGVVLRYAIDAELKK